jgi:hypothetical protein
MTIEAALTCGPQNAGEHVLGDGAARRPIASPIHLRVRTAHRIACSARQLWHQGREQRET